MKKNFREIANLIDDEAEKEFGVNVNYIRGTCRDIATNLGSSEFGAYYLTAYERDPFIPSESYADYTFRRRMFSSEKEETFYRQVNLYLLKDGTWAFCFAPWHNIHHNRTPLGDPFAGKYSVLRIRDAKVDRTQLPDNSRDMIERF